MTLVELMVVVSIILILVAVSAVVVFRSMDRGKVAQCVSNLHQLDIATRLYASDNDGFTPFIHIGSLRLMSAWKDALLPYADDGVFYCPSDRSAKKPGKGLEDNYGRSFYTSYSDWLGYGSVTTQIRGLYVTQVDEVPDPANSLHHNDYTIPDYKDCFVDEQGSYYGNYSPHGKTYCVLYWDGHVKSQHNVWFDNKNRTPDPCP